MCLFPLPNNNFNSEAYKKGVKEFNCNACPECLHSRASYWALRAVYEAKSHAENCMVTLTYDNYLRDKSGRIIGELPPDRNLRVDKRDIQLFVKRLRKWYSTISSTPIKYIITAEYGPHTGRAHYHCIFFGLKFPDLVMYKKSKRGSILFKSAILTSLWGKGICTVDSTCINSAAAHYCTKYCAKSRSLDTFMLFSHHVGTAKLLEEFNGLPYVVQGRLYPIPRVIWEAYVMRTYSSLYPGISPKYVNHSPLFKEGLCPYDFDYDLATSARRAYRAVRDNDPLYKRYLDFCKNYYGAFASARPPVLTRILQLSDKFAVYKTEALKCYNLRKNFIPAVAPRSGCRSAYERYKFELVPTLCPTRYLPYSPCLNTANDTNLNICPFDNSFLRDFDALPDVSLCNMHKNVGEQLEFFL